MDNLLNSCKEGLQVVLPECPEVIRVELGLTASTDYWYFVKNRFSKTIAKKITTDTEGKFDIDVTDFPSGSFNRHSGFFELRLKKVIDQCDYEVFTCDTVECNFVLFSFENVELIDDLNEAVIKCCTI